MTVLCNIVRITDIADFSEKKSKMKNLFNPPWYFPALAKHYERMVSLAHSSRVRGIYLCKLLDARFNWVTLGGL